MGVQENQTAAEAEKSGQSNPQTNQPKPPGGTNESPTTATFTQADIDLAVQRDRSQYGRDIKAIEALKVQEAAIKAREDAVNAKEQEFAIANIATENGLDVKTLKEAAAELKITTTEQIAALAKRLAGTGAAAGAADFVPDSGKIAGGGPDTSRYSSGQFFEKGLEQLRKKK